MVLHKYGDRLYTGLKKTLTDQLKTVAGRIEASQGLPFLRELKKRWDEHLKATQMIRDILMVRVQGSEVFRNILMVRVWGFGLEVGSGTSSW